jgi:hypothetical protein
MAIRRQGGIDSSVLAAALIGYEQMKKDVEEKIADIRSRLNGGSGASDAPKPAGRRTLSLKARRSISAAQRKRWAAFRTKSDAPAAAPAPVKRTMSASARKRIAAAQRKRWALLKAKQKSA